MERVMSIEERIKRAEEISERRRQGTTRPVAKVNVSEKKDIKLLKKMIIQVLICITIYGVIYMINKNDFPFSNDFINKANEILSYDTNFIEIYEYIKNNTNEWFKQNQENNSQQEIIPPEEAIGGADESNSEQTNTVENSLEQNSGEQNQETSSNKPEENIASLPQGEQDIINIKNTTTFIKPIEGIISSKYGQRDTATGNVPKNHTGIDIAADMGTKIKSATDGEVVLASEQGDYRKTFKNTNRRSKYYLCALQQSICKTRR